MLRSIKKHWLEMHKIKSLSPKYNSVYQGLRKWGDAGITFPGRRELQLDVGPNCNVNDPIVVGR